jgi:hypothetical protein
VLRAAVAGVGNTRPLPHSGRAAVPGAPSSPRNHDSCLAPCIPLQPEGTQVTSSTVAGFEHDFRDSLQDALTLQHSCFSDWTLDSGAHSPRQVSGLPLISQTASAGAVQPSRGQVGHRISTPWSTWCDCTNAQTLRVVQLETHAMHVPVLTLLLCCAAVLDMLTPVSVAVHADRDAFMSPLEIPPMML